MQDTEQNTAPVGEVTQGEMPTTEDVFYNDLGDELFKKTLPFLNDVLSKLLTVSIALSAGSGFFLNEKGYPWGMKIAVMLMFLVAFVVSVIGIIPRGDSALGESPNAIRESIIDAIRWKDGCICFVAAFIILGVMLAAAGFFLLVPPH